MRSGCEEMIPYSFSGQMMVNIVFNALWAWEAATPIMPLFLSTMVFLCSGLFFIPEMNSQQSYAVLTHKVGTLSQKVSRIKG